MNSFLLGPSGTGKTKFINSYLTPHSKDNFDTKYWITIVDTFSANGNYLLSVRYV
jgi:hypothetical protein